MTSQHFAMEGFAGCSQSTACCVSLLPEPGGAWQKATRQEGALSPRVLKATEQKGAMWSLAVKPFVKHHPAQAVNLVDCEQPVESHHFKCSEGCLAAKSGTSWRGVGCRMLDNSCLWRTLI